MNSSSNAAIALAPTGKLRSVINVGNPVLASLNPETGRPEGVSVDLANQLAAKLNISLELVIVDVARSSVEAIEMETADIGFVAIDPARAAHIAFSAPYVLIEGSYLVPAESHIAENDDVDREGHIVVVGKGSAYDLYLTRTLHKARIERVPSSSSVIDAFLSLKADAAAGIKPVLQAEAARLQGLRLLDGRFMLIEQAMAVHKNRGSMAHAYVAQFVEEMKASGFVAESLLRHDIRGASVARAE